MRVRDNAFKYYFYFAQERMKIFWKRYEGKKPPYTKDPILTQYRFTNCYRVLDRVSQYLIKDVIYTPEARKLNEEDVVLRILLFKIFNKIETWEAIQEGLGGSITTKTWNVKRVNEILGERINVTTLFSNAYMLTGCFYSKFKGGEDKFKHKHERYVQVLNDEIMDPKFVKSIVKAKSLEDVYKSFLGITYVAKFLAMQYSIDLNYSQIINFSEDDFIIAGKGAIRGIHKAVDLGNWSEEKFIKWAQEKFDEYAEYYGYNKFRPLPNHPLSLLDCQNLFCEFDKFCRVADPSLKIYDKGKDRKIKNKFKMNSEPIEYFFPPKWKVKL